MAKLSHKTTLLLSDDDYRLLQQQADLTDQTMGEVIRTAVRKSYRKFSPQEAKKAWQRLYKLNAPVASVAAMKRESIKGRLGP